VTNERRSSGLRSFVRQQYRGFKLFALYSRQILFSLHYVLSPIQHTLAITAFHGFERPFPMPTPATASWFPPRVLEAVSQIQRAIPVSH